MSVSGVRVCWKVAPKDHPRSEPEAHPEKYSRMQMTSKQVMLVAVAILLGGCALLDTVGLRSNQISSPYGTRRIWAVAALRRNAGHGAGTGRQP
jgi:hypothetical protein